MTARAFCMTKLVVNDIDATARFYCQVFGMQELHRVTSDEHEYAQDETILSLTGKSDTHRLAIVSYRRLPIPPAGAAWTGFVVSDIEATLRAIEQCGGKIEVAVHPNLEHGVLAAIATDPEGHVIEVIQMLAAT